MRLFVLGMFLFVWLQAPTPTPRKNGQPKQHQPKTSEQPSANDQRGTEQSPLVIKVLDPTKHKEETADTTSNRQEKPASNWTAIFTGLLVLSAFLQTGVYLWQATLLRATVKSASEQSAAMERHIGEASRSADAMEEIAETIEAGNKAIIRAYLTVVVGDIHLFQERREPGQEDLKFETRPNLVNNGNTPARNVSIRIAADILPIPIPQNFDFPLPENKIKDAGIVGPRQVSILAGTVDRFIPDEQIGTTKEGRNQALCVWGLITYNDIFGEEHRTKFGQWITWNPNGKVVGYYVAGQNDVD